jgi:disulfide bond formation protein DsbB
VHDPTTANAFFTVLTILADAAVVALVAVGLGALVSVRGRALADHLVRAVGPNARGLALLVAATATAGSLYYSEVVGFTPCELCWFQRICMYPLVAVLAVGVLRRRDRAAGWYAAPLVAVGAPLGLYHWLVERVPSLASSTSCSLAAPCAVPYFEELGYITLAFMAMSAFVLIGALLLVDRAWSRHLPKETS